MTHIYTHFDTVPLPLHRQRYQHDPASSVPALRRVIGGYFDIFGTDEADALSQIIPITGIYIGETTYLVDEAGNRFVDEAGNAYIFGTPFTMLRSQIQALSEMARLSAPLWRVRLDEQTVREWKTARLVQLRLPANFNDLYIAEVTASFETFMPNWHAETVTTVSASLTNGVAKLVMVENPAETVNDATVTLTRTSGTITAFTLSCTALGISWLWVGSLGAGDVLTIDSLNETVIKGSTGAYSGFSRPGHTERTWLPLLQGNWPFTATVTGGNATLAINFYSQVK